MISYHKSSKFWPSPSIELTFEFETNSFSTLINFIVAQIQYNYFLPLTPVLAT